MVIAYFILRCLVFFVCLFTGKPSPWLSVDTALYILKESENQANLQLMCFTELQHREVYIFIF